MAVWDDPTAIYSDTPIEERRAFAARMAELEEEGEIERLRRENRELRRQLAAANAALATVQRLGVRLAAAGMGERAKR